ncbi:MAG TPA: FAD-dependent oxidoreductase, partial [Clostridia bacterium]|nr:FAD-dependent oxidoreductase [Clostridia bacterium]
RIVYRRSMEEMPARKEEIHHAIEEGIIFDLLVNPIEVIGEDSKVKGLKCVRMELGEPDESGRRRPVEIKGSEYVIECDIVIIAIGTTPNPLITSTTKGIATNKHGCIITDNKTMATTLEGVYAGGDAVTGAATVILAMGAGKKAAAAMDEYLRKKREKK